MAARKFRSDEVRKTEYSWKDVYTGTAVALIKAGVVEEHMLPGQPGRNKTSVTFNGKSDADYMQIARRGPNVFIVRKGIGEEEHKRRSRLFEERIAANLRKEESSPDAIRTAIERAIRDSLCSAAIAFNLVDSNARPYSFDEKTRTEVERHLVALVRLARGKGLRLGNGPQAQQDGDFQRFMNLTTRGPA
jgi:hypothetical protein